MATYVDAQAYVVGKSLNILNQSKSRKIYMELS